MKKRILSILLCVCMMLSLLPTTALATAWSGVTDGGIGFNYTGKGGGTFIDITMPTTDGYYAYGTCRTSDNITTAEQTESNSATLPESGWNWSVKKETFTDSNSTTYDYIVTFKNFDLYYSGTNDAFMCKTKIKLMLEGTNIINAPHAGTGLSAKVSYSFYIDGTGSLDVTGDTFGISSFKISGGTVTARGNTNAYNTATSGIGGPDFSGYANCVATASTDADGTSAVTYDSADFKTYKYFHIEPDLSVMSVDFDGDGTFENSYTDFATGWAAAINAGTATVKLLADWTATGNGSNNSFGTGDGFASGAILVPAGQNITLDLNGHNIDRALTAAADDGYVIKILDTNGTAKLTIKDSSSEDVSAQGKITGGYNKTTSDGAGGIRALGNLALEGGNITGNKSITWGGGVYLGGGTKRFFNMTGGKISGNLANYKNVDNDGGAGGVFVGGGATFTMTGGEISGNYACQNRYGGVYIIGSTMTVGGTAVIKDNLSKCTYTATDGTSVGTIGTGSSSASNVYLPMGNTITCSKTTALTTGASIGVTTAATPVSGTPVAITGGNSADYSSYFHSDAGYYSVNTGSGDAQVVKLQLEKPTVNAATPSITTNLSTTEVPYTQNESATALTIAASVSDSGTLSYQWYSNATNSTVGGTTVGTDSNSYTPPTTSTGTTYYYCVVKNTITDNGDGGTKTATTTSNIAKITVNAAATPAAAPVIDTNLSPNQVNYTVGATATALTITAHSTDGGMLSYQWYSKTSSGGTGSLISGAESASYTPPTDAAVYRYYYCIVTNTKGGQTETTTSAEARISVVIPSLNFLDSHEVTMPTTVGNYTYGTCDGTTFAETAANADTLPKSGWTWAIQYHTADANGVMYTLTLNNINIKYTGTSDCIKYRKMKLNLVLVGDNTIYAPSAGAAFINESNADIGALYISGIGSLTATGKNLGICAGGDLTISSGTVSVKTISNCSYALHSIRGNISITGGTVTATATRGSALVPGSGCTTTVSGGSAYYSSSTDGSNLQTYVSGGSGGCFFVYNAAMLVTTDSMTVGYADCATGWNAAVAADSATVKLLADWTAANDQEFTKSFGTGTGFYSGGICVPSGKTVTLDLNGKTIDRNLTSARTDGYVIILNNGTLTLQDSSDPDTGKITGGNNSTTNSGIGGGVSVDGFFTMNGGIITGNEACYGGGVYVLGSFTMNGGTISNNTAVYSGGTTGTGGGVHVFSNATSAELLGGAITGNHAETKAGGVGCSGPTTVGGTINITGNTATASNTTSNLYVYSGKTITCSTTTPLTSGASIGVTTATAPVSGTPVAITGSNSANYSSYFSSDAGYTVANTGSGSAQIVQLQAGALVDAATPGITTNLSTSEVSYTKDATAIALDATATVTDGGTITYDWYSNDEQNTTTPTQLNVATATYTPPTSSTGTTYYYCVVTNTNNSVGGTKTATTTSAIAKITVNAALVNAATPSITTDLSEDEVKYAQNATATALDATATVADSGTLSYQWYSNDTNDTTTPTAVGTDSATYTPLTSSNGTTYYYCVVTNTNNSVSGTKTATTTSSIAKITTADAVMSVRIGMALTNYADFAAGWTAAQGQTATVMLLADWTATSGSFGTGNGFGTYVSALKGNIRVTSGSDITLDLSGHTISRGLTSATDDGFVILVNGTLTIKDSTNTGKITGGYTNSNGGGIYVNGDGMLSGGAGTLKLSSGTITGNKADGNGAGVYAAAGGTIQVGGGSPKVEGNTLSGGTDNNVYLSSGQTISLMSGLQNYLNGGAFIGVTTADTPTSGTPVAITSGCSQYSSSFHSDANYMVYSNGSELNLAVTTTNLFSAKFYEPQLWDCQRSPAFPRVGKALAISYLEPPYDDALTEIDFNDDSETGRYVQFSLTGQTLGDLDDASLVASLKRYLDSSVTEQQIKDGALVKETLYNSNGTNPVVLSDYGLVFALSGKGFLYVSLSDSLKYSGGVGTFVSTTALNDSCGVVLEQQQEKPYTIDQLNGNDGNVFNGNGDSVKPEYGVFDLAITLVDASGNITDTQKNVAVSMTYNGSTYNGTTNSNGIVVFSGLYRAVSNSFNATAGGNTTYTNIEFDSDSGVATLEYTGATETKTQAKTNTLTINVIGDSYGTVKFDGMQVPDDYSYPGEVEMPTGSDLLLEWSANSSCEVTSVKINNIEDSTAKANGYYEIANLTSNTSITITFGQVAEPGVSILNAKFYEPQLWDCQRSPAFPVEGRSFRISGLKAPYDQNLQKISFASSDDYVTFVYVSAVSELPTDVQNRIVSSVKRYTGATEEEIRAAAVVKEVLHSGAGQATETTLSTYGLVWGLSEEGFLYTAMNGAYKYSGGVGTFVSFKAHKSGDSVIYTTEQDKPYTKEQLDSNDNKFAPEEGKKTVPNSKTYQELIRVIDGSGTAVSGATVKITVNSTVYTGTTNASGYAQFSGLSAQAVTSATVQSGSYATLTYATVASPEAVLVYTNPASNDSGSQQAKVTVTVNKTGSGTVEYLGAGTDTNPYALTSGDTAMFSIMPADGYEITAATWGGANVLPEAKDGFFSATVSENKAFAVTFTAITPTDGIGNVKFTTRNLFDTQRSAAFPQNGRIMNFFGLKAPYDNSLHTVTLTSGQYIKFELISSVETAGKTDAFYNSVHWYSGATKQQVGEAAYVKEVLYNANDTVNRDLGTGMIWAYEDESFGFLFTALDGSYASSAGVGTLFTFKPVAYGSHLALKTSVIKPLPYGNVEGELDWNDYKPIVTPDNGQIIDETYDYGGIILDNNGDPKSDVEVKIVIGDDTYTATTDDKGRFIIHDLPNDSNGELFIDSKDIGSIELTDDDTKGFGNDSNERSDTGDDTNVFKDNGTTYQKMDKVTVTVTTGANGTASQSTTSVSYGSSLGVYFTANAGYTLSKIKVNSVENADALTAGGYVFSNITSAQTIESTFAVQSTPTYLLTVNLNGGSGSTTGGSYANGASVSINAGTKSGYTFSGWTSSNGGAFASTSSASTTFTMPAAATTITAIWTASGGSGSGSGSGSDGSSGSTTTTSKADPIYVDGTEYDIGNQTGSGDKTTVTVDQTKLTEQIDKATTDVLVPVSDKTNTAVAQLVVKNVEDMAKKGMTLSVQTGDVTYQMPTTAVDTETLMTTLGATDASKVPVNVTITNLEAGSVTTDKGTVVLNPVEFTVTATYGGKTVEVELFSRYVQRVIELPVGYDASKITTAIRTDDGEHVPTQVYQKDGKYYVKINSLTNSTYALIYNQQNFADASGKWYEAAADEMASRCVIFGRTDGSFDGEANVTRAEFAAIIVRALGLPSDGTENFTDVADTAWCAGAIGAAYEYGIVNGRTSTIFDPNACITRQEAMAMIQRAAEVAEFTGTTGSLAAFSDADSVGAWAKDAVAFNVGSGLIVGADGKLNVNAPITRAQTAVIVLRLLQKAELVDVRTTI